MTARIFTAINLLLIAAAAYFGVSSFYAVLTAGMDYGARPAAGGILRPATPEAHRPPPRTAYQAIIERNLFGAAGAPEEKPPEKAGLDLDKLEQTKLQLKLWGTVAGEGKQAYAVIEDTKTRQQALYHPGDTVQNATVKMILRHKVVLTVDGRDEILAMIEPGQGGTAARGAATGAPAVGAAAAPPRLPISGAPRQITVRSEHIAQAMENIGELMSQATFRPYLEDGRPAGISITRIKPSAIFRRLRLRNGDIITGVNGNPVASVEDALRVFEGLNENPNIQLQIKRRGRQQTLEYRIE